MNPERTQAYGRVMRTLDDLGPSKLLPDEQDRIRLAADNLIFSGDASADEGARDALADTERLRHSLVDSGRWERVTADRLVADLRECGPGIAEAVAAAA